MPNSKNRSEIPKVNESKEVFHNSIIHLRCDMLQRGCHPAYPYYVLKLRPFAVIILAFTVDKRIVTIQEYRHPTEKFLLSFPAGYVEIDEDPLDAARRELLEETGYEAESFEIIGQAYPYAGISNQQNIYVRAKGAKYCQSPQLEKSEIIEAKLLSKEKLLAQVDQGIALDANVLTALYFSDQKNT